MRIALCSDEPYPVHATVQRLLRERGHEVEAFGAIADGEEHAWASTAERASRAIVEGRCEEGIFFCWTGTGISIAANKVPGIRAALCSDPGQAAAARVWNHANVLCLSNRTLSDDIAKEIVAAWFDTEQGQRGAEGVQRLNELEARSFGAALAGARDRP